MNIIFFGTPKETIPVLESLIKNFDVVTVITAPDQKSGRKQLLTPTPVKTAAQKLNIPVITPQQLNNEAIEQLRSFKPDLFVVAAYGKLIPNDILELPKYGAINIHPSLLPKYRGPTPLQTALLNGEETSGVTFIKMDEQLDHGPILQQIPFTFEQTDTFDRLMQSIFAQAAHLLPQVIDEYISGKRKPKPQDDNKATYTKRITKQDGYIDLSVLEKLKPLEIEKWKLKIARKIRAYYPWPTVWTLLRLSASEGQAKGKIVKFLPNNQIQVEGKNPVSLKDFLNGYPEMKEKIEKLFSNNK